MGSLKERISGEPLHGRSIDMKTYALDEETILVEGWLREDRFHTVFQGALAHKRRHPIPVPNAIEEVAGLEYLLGSCRAWGPDGPKMRNLKAAISR